MAFKVYIMENLGCANCASKIERKASALPGVQDLSITFSTKQLRVTADDPDALIPEIQKIANSFEPEIIITERKRNSSRNTPSTVHSSESCCDGHDHEHHHEHEHHDGENCSCGHEHQHEHEHHHGENCSCGHEQQHGHEHHHGENCSCGHDHEHHHGENCSCGHEQQHGHEHHHGENCSCGHDHEHHHHDENCSCGHDHQPKHKHHPASRPDTPSSHSQRPHQEAASNASDTASTKTHSGAAAKLSENTRDLIAIGSGAFLFLLGIVLENIGIEIPSIAVFVVGYVILGGEIVWTAVKNLLKGHVFDENFLMSIATLGAFVIQEYPEAVGVMLFYRIGEYFEHKAVEKSRSQIMEAIDLRPETVNLIVGDDIQVIDAQEAEIGDLLLVRPGDRIPLDGVIVEGESRIDTSPVTGEPVPVKAEPGSSVISGCINTSGLLKIRAEKVLEDSMVSRILDSVENAAASKPKIDRFITRFARIYTPCVVLLALGTAVIPSLITGNWDYWVYTALSFLVMSCPCALVLSVPLAFFAGIGTGSKTGILFKGGVSLEAITKIKTVIMDKTGTITKGNFIVQEILPASEAVSKEELLAWCASCELSSTHPIGNSIVTAAKEKNPDISRPLQVEEIAGHGIKAVLDNGTFLCGNTKLMEKFGISLDGYRKTSYGTEVLAAKDGVFIGHLVISDTVKEDAENAVSQMKRLGITPVMLTGDAQDSAEAVADLVGIKEVHARLLPEDKLNELNKIRASHGAVMFVGDGINDAPVLAGADVGAAMGSGADAAIEAADVVFMTSNMAAIPQAIDIARVSTKISWQNVIFALTVKILVMILGLVGFASMWMAVFADTGVAMICVLNSIRILYRKQQK
ncbi:MAG: cadmium-translocating P-type ATPase [Clostridiales bacterium]|nr:cadmium-translocating P-type ATPase [Clostridiales bacterium]